MARGRKEETETTRKTRFPDIPEEIILQILSNLPVKSLLRFMCVSKRWRFLTSDPRFNLSMQRQHVLAVSEFGKADCSFHCISGDGSAVEVPKPKPLQLATHVRIRGSCNGLLLLHAWGDMFMWNPLTGCCKKVISHKWLSESTCYVRVSGLFYNSSTNDYKAIFAMTNYNRPLDEVSHVCMVGSFRNKSWTEIRFPYDEQIGSGTMVNGHLHWLVSKSSREEDGSSLARLIIYFVPQTNEFVRVPMPEGDGKSEEIYLCVGVSDGSLLLAQYTRNNPGSDVVEVFVMKKFGEKESWTSLFYVSMVDGFDYYGYELVSLCGFKDRVVLMLWESTEKTIAYDLKQNLIAYFPIPNKTWDVEAATFVESLASPPGRYKEEEEYPAGRGRVHANFPCRSYKQVEAHPWGF